MTTVAGYVSALTGGFWAGDAPSAPTLSVVAASTTAVTVTVSGDGTITTYYRRSDESAWTTGRVGSGAITGLTAGRAYEFVAVATVDGCNSAPSNVASVNLETSTDASGLLSLPVSNLRTLISTSATFQAWVGADNAAEALEHIYLGDVQGVGSRPFCLVFNDDPASRELMIETLGVGASYSVGGAVVAYFEADVASADLEDEAAEIRAFENRMGDVIDDIRAAAGTGSYFLPSAIRCIKGPLRSSDRESASGGDYYECAWEFEYEGSR